MTVISVTPKYSGLSGKGSLQGVREYTKVFVVRTDSAGDGVMAVGNALGLPRKGYVYTWRGETDAGALCWSVEPRQDPENQKVWEVTCEYSSDLKGGAGGPLGGDPRYDVDDPLAAPPEVTWGDWTETETLTHDVNGRAILTAAGRPYNPPLTHRVRHQAITIIRNEAVYPVEIDQAYSGCINSDGFYDWAPGTVLLDSVTGTGHFAQAMFYWRVKYELRCRKRGWSREVARVDTMSLRLGGPAALWEIPSDDDGIYHTNPMYLDEDGVLLTPEEVVARRDVPRGQPGGLFDYWEIHEAKAFSALNL